MTLNTFSCEVDGLLPTCVKSKKKKVESWVTRLAILSSCNKVHWASPGITWASLARVVYFCLQLMVPWCTSFSACPRGAPFMMCLANPCERAKCPANPKAKCRANSCGRCTPQFFDDNDNLVNCLASKYLQPTLSFCIWLSLAIYNRIL